MARKGIVKPVKTPEITRSKSAVPAKKAIPTPPKRGKSSR